MVKIPKDDFLKIAVNISFKLHSHMFPNNDDMICSHFEWENLPNIWAVLDFVFLCKHVFYVGMYN
jgi:hypothetical protein